MCQKLCRLFFLSCHLDLFFLLTDIINISDHDPALFPGKILCFQAYAVITVIGTIADTARSFILTGSYLHGKRTGFFCFSVIITDLCVFFSNINSYDQVTNFIHLSGSFSMTNISLTYCSCRRYCASFSFTSVSFSSFLAQSI